MPDPKSTSEIAAARPVSSVTPGSSVTKERAIEALVEIATEAASPHAFFKRALPVMAASLQSAYMSVEIRHGGTVMSEAWNHPDSTPELWTETAETLLTDTMVEMKTRARIFVGREVDVRVAFLCSPIGIRNRHGGALVAVMPFRDSSAVDAGLELLDVLCALASTLVETLGNLRSSSAPAAAGLEASEDEVASIRKVGAFTSETELAFAITNKLRTRDGCDQVVLSGVKGQRVRLLSISGSDSIAPRSPGTKLIRAAVEECVDLRKSVVDQDQDLVQGGNIVTGGRLHRSWRESVGGGCVASIPLFEGEELVAVLSIRRGSSQPFATEDLDELQTLVEPYAAGLEMVRAARRSLGQHAVGAVRESVGSIFAAGSYGKKLLLLMAAALIGWAFYGSVPYSVQAPCELAPAQSRQLAAASDAVLVASFVLPGDVVVAGDLLCEFDTSELELERARLEGELAIIEVDRFRALESGSPSELELATANGRVIRANLALVEYRIRASTVRATIDGIVLAGDHRSRIGDAFSKGEPLFELAPTDGWKLNIRVGEDDIDAIEAGMTGEFASHSRPEDSCAFEVARLAPSAEARDGDNFFTVEAACEVPAEWARSGMEGFASVDVGERAPAWVLFHRALDFARLRLWL